MQIKVQMLPRAEALLTLEIQPDEYQKFMLAATQKMSTKTKIDGFRPGYAPYNIVKQRVGEGEILNEALSEIISRTFAEAILKEKINTLGSPEITIKKMTPGDNLIYEARVSVLPEITPPNLVSLSLKKSTINIEEKEVDKILERLAKSRATEILETRPAENNDLVKLDYQISIAGVPQENGSQKNFPVFLGEEHMIPGFEKQIIGMVAGETKKFDTAFPKEYFQNNFANKNCEFTVTVNAVYRLEIPKPNDDFAKTIGDFQNIEDLRKHLKENLTAEKQIESNRQLENELLKTIIDKTGFPELPEKLMANEVHLMIHELERDLANRGLDLATWLTNLNKTEAGLKKDLRPQAEVRAKSILLLRALAKKENISVSENEIDDEVKNITNLYQDNKKFLAQVKSSDYRYYLAQTLTNKKVIDWLKEKIVKE